MFYTEDKKQYSVLNRRTFFLYILKLSLFSIVGWRLYNIQIKESDKYKTLSKNNKVDAPFSCLKSILSLALSEKDGRESGGKGKSGKS